MGSATHGEEYDNARKQLTDAKIKLRKQERDQAKLKDPEEKIDAAKRHLARVRKVLDDVKDAKSEALNILKNAKKQHEITEAKKAFDKAAAQTSPDLRRKVRAMEEKVERDAEKLVLAQKKEQAQEAVRAAQDKKAPENVDVFMLDAI